MDLFPAVFILCVFAGVQVTSAFFWKSTHALPDNVTLAACQGQKVALHWQYNHSRGEHPKDEEWHFVQDGGNSDVLLAARVQGQFIPEAGNTTQLEFIPNAGVRLLNVSVRNSGLYYVKAMFNVHGSIITYTQRAHVHVSASTEEVVEHGHLAATIQPGARFNSQTRTYHLVLACSRINAPWRNNSTRISWTTPDHKVLQTSWWQHGTAYLSVPNPVTSGNYTCNLHTAVQTCSSPQSSSPEGAAVRVDGLEARLSLLEGELQGMRNQGSELQSKVDNLQSENQLLRQRLAVASQSISFDVNLQTQTTSDSPLRFNDVTSNEGNAFNVTSGEFVAPLNGTYVFHLTLVSSNPNRTDDSRITAFLVVEGEKVASALASRVTGHYSTGSVDVVKPLGLGQRVWVVNDSSGQRHFTFSVYLSGLLVKAGL